MSDHEDLVRSLLVERFRPWRSEGEQDVTPQQLARTIGREKRGTSRSATYQQRRPRQATTEGKQTP